MKKGIIITAIVLLLLYFVKKMNDKSEKNVIGFKFDNAQDYINTLKPIAIELQNKSGIPYLFILAQTALETGYGKSSLVYEAANFAGIKATGNQPYVTKYTYEYVKSPDLYPQRDKSKDKYDVKTGKTRIYLPQNFAKYNSLIEGLTAYIRVLLLPRYKAAFNYTNDINKFVDEIYKGGYATDINYPSKIKTMIQTIKTKYGA